MEEDKNIQALSAPQIKEEKDPTSFRLIFTLGLAGFVGGIVMVTAYLITRPFIEANKKAAIESAIFKVLPGCTSYKTLQLKNGKLFSYDSKEENSAKSENLKLAYMGFSKSDTLVGFAVVGNEVGFADVISALIGYDANKKTIIGFEVLDSKETPGLGDKITKDSSFQKNFIALFTEPEILFSKRGEKQKDNEVEGITGATISSKAVIRLLNKTMKDWKGPIADFMKENNGKTVNTK
jgi:electron transport complex protein RnfG